MESNWEYLRRDSVGVLKLRGVVDIFEASALHSQTKLALQDPSVESFELDCQEVERLDLTSYQVLKAFGKACDQTGKPVSVLPLPASLDVLQQLGLTL